MDKEQAKLSLLNYLSEHKATFDALDNPEDLKTTVEVICDCIEFTPNFKKLIVFMVLELLIRENISFDQLTDYYL